MTPPVAGFVLLPATNGASAENGVSPKFQTSEANKCEEYGSAAPQLMRDSTVQLSCNPLGYDYFASLTTELQAR